MTLSHRTPAAEALTDAILALFRVNNLLLNGGDRLVAPLHLTSARWQILGAIEAARDPQPVAWLARDLGANRQNVQRIVNDLATAGLVSFQTNPHHQRAKLVVLTRKGRETCDAAMRLQAPWVNELADGFTEEEIAATLRVMLILRGKLTGEQVDPRPS